MFLQLLCKIYKCFNVFLRKISCQCRDDVLVSPINLFPKFTGNLVIPFIARLTSGEISYISVDKSPPPRRWHSSYNYSVFVNLAISPRPALLLPPYFHSVVQLPLFTTARNHRFFVFFVHDVQTVPQRSPVIYLSTCRRFNAMVASTSMLSFVCVSQRENWMQIIVKITFVHSKLINKNCTRLIYSK